MTTELNNQEKAEVDSMTLLEMLREWRNAPIGRFQNGDPWTDYFIKVMGEKREADPAGWTAASKRLSR